MSDIFSFEQILGYIASVFILTGYAIKSDKTTKIVLVFSSLFFAWHFFLLSAFTAMAICMINSMRNALSIFLYKSKVTFVIFASAYLAFGLWTYQELIDFLPLTASIITCLGMFLLGGIGFRILVVIATILWIIHNIYVGSIGGTINTIILFFISSSVVYRLRKEGSRNEAQC